MLVRHFDGKRELVSARITGYQRGEEGGRGFIGGRSSDCNIKWAGPSSNDVDCPSSNKKVENFSSVHLS